MSIAAQIGVTPVLLATFGSVPVVSPLANLLAAPAAEALGVFGLLASVVGGVLPPLGAVLAPVVELLVAWVSVVAHSTAGLGGEICDDAALVLVTRASCAAASRLAVGRRRPAAAVRGWCGR